MSAPTNEKKLITDVFIEGSRKGWQIAVSNIIPNVLMAFVIIHALKVTGVLTIISKVFGAFMGVFGLPGEAAAVLMGAWMSMGGGGRRCHRPVYPGNFEWNPYCDSNTCHFSDGRTTSVCRGACWGQQRSKANTTAYYSASVF